MLPKKTIFLSLIFILASLLIHVFLFTSIYFFGVTISEGSKDLGEGGLEKGKGLLINIGAYTKPNPDQQQSEKPIKEKVKETVEPLSLPRSDPKIKPESEIPLSQQNENPQITPKNDTIKSATLESDNEQELDIQANNSGASDVISSGSNKLGLRQSYNALIISRLNQYKIYPTIARRRGMEGIATLQFTIAANGEVTFKRLKKSSGYVQLDKSALNMLRKASPFPKIPEELKLKELSISVPVKYLLSE